MLPRVLPRLFLSRSVTRTSQRLFTLSAIAMTTKVNKTDSEWRATLSPEQFRVLRQKGEYGPMVQVNGKCIKQKLVGTEPPGTGEYNKHYEKGKLTSEKGTRMRLTRAYLSRCVSLCRL